MPYKYQRMCVLYSKLTNVGRVVDSKIIHKLTFRLKLELERSVLDPSFKINPFLYDLCEQYYKKYKPVMMDQLDKQESVQS